MSLTIYATGLPLFDGASGACRLCGFFPKMGNRRTSASRRNWRAYCEERHARLKHADAAGTALIPPHPISAADAQARWEQAQEDKEP